MGVPEELCAVTDTFTQSAITNANLALFGPRPIIDKAFRDSKFADQALGIDDWYYDPNMATHTTGTFTASTPAVVGGSQSGSTLAIDGMGTYALVEGDVFTIDGVYGVNPVSFVDQGILQQFMLTADVAGSSTATLSFSPSLIARPGQLQTVTNLPADNAAINFLGATGSVGGTMTAHAVAAVDGLPAGSVRARDGVAAGQPARRQREDDFGPGGADLDALRRAVSGVDRSAPAPHRLAQRHGRHHPRIRPAGVELTSWSKPHSRQRAPSTRRRSSLRHPRASSLGLGSRSIRKKC